MDGFINFQLLSKLLVVAILTPSWLPVVRELWKEINASLVEEGGVFGELPTEVEAARLLQTRRLNNESLISVPRVASHGPGAHRKPGQSSRGPRPRGF